MGTPYNFLQDVIPSGLEPKRFIGTVVQPKFFYGIDHFPYTFEYTGLVKGVYFDFVGWRYEITTGTFTPALRERLNHRAEYTGIFEGAGVERFHLATTWSGDEKGLIKETAILGNDWSGATQGIPVEVGFTHFAYTTGIFDNLPTDKPSIGFSMFGKIGGFKQDTMNATYFFETGEYYKGRFKHESEKFEPGEFMANYFYLTGRYQGPIS